MYYYWKYIINNNLDVASISQRFIRLLQRYVYNFFHNLRNRWEEASTRIL